jgi:hypothetical protein
VEVMDVLAAHQNSASDKDMGQVIGDALNAIG